MAENLAAHEQLVVKQERIRRELELCRLIQNEMLPHQPLRLGLAEVKGVSIPAREVGGDFFNYFVLPGGEIALLVGDVSGKGVGAALLMANVQATLRARLPLEQDLAQLADALDRDLEANTPPEVYSDALRGHRGHQAPRTSLRQRRPQLRSSSSATQRRLRAHGLHRPAARPAGRGGLRGGHAAARRRRHPLLLHRRHGRGGERGAASSSGAERLEAALASSPRPDVDSVLVHVEDTVRAFRGSAELSDDATMMALRFGANELPRQALV